jgi:hypothetical protein
MQARPYEQFSRDKLAEAAKDSTSMRQILCRLGVSEYARARNDVRRQLRAHAIVEPTRYRRLEFDESTLRIASASSHSVAEVLRLLGLPVNETNRSRVLRGLGRYNIDTSHFRHPPTSTIIKQRALDPKAILLSGPNCHSQTETFAGRNRARLRKPAVIL